MSLSVGKFGFCLYRKMMFPMLRPPERDTLNRDMTP